MADAPGGHDLVQAPPARALRPPRLLALAQLGVEAPHGDEQHHVAHGPEEAEEAEARDHQVPQFQVPQLKEGRTAEGRDQLEIRGGEVKVCHQFHPNPFSRMFV